MSINAEEVKKFDSMASQWWDENGNAKPLHHINPARLEYIKRYLNDPNSKVMDIGCGAGILTESLVKLFQNTIGVDASPEMIEIAREHAKSQNLNVNYYNSSIEKIIAEISEPFDAIVCMELLEHLDDPYMFIKNCYQCLKPGGKLFLSTINRNLKSYLGAIIGAEHILKLLPKGTHSYGKFLKPSELNRILIANSFETKDITGLEYNPLLKSASLTNNLDINYLVFAIKG